MYQYDPKRYRVAPWKPPYGSQAHRVKVNPHHDKIKGHIAAKRKEILRLDQQIRQLEELERISAGTIQDGVLVIENCGSAVSDPSHHYAIAANSNVVSERRSAKIYPNATRKGLFGYHIHWGGYPFSNEEWRGSGHTLEQAIEGARAWVLRKEKMPMRVDQHKDGSIKEWP